MFNPCMISQLHFFVILIMPGNKFPCNTAAHKCNFQVLFSNYNSWLTKEVCRLTFSLSIIKQYKNVFFSYMFYNIL